jgi:hypothetical protein
MSLMEKCKRWYWKKQNYQFGAPIVALYAYQQYLVVATKLDLFISPDGVNYQKVNVNE